MSQQAGNQAKAMHATSPISQESLKGERVVGSGLNELRISSLLAGVEDNGLQKGIATWVMNTFQPGNIRNFAIVGHASSGKTMLSEAMLACSGVINRLGKILAGTNGGD